MHNVLKLFFFTSSILLASENLIKDINGIEFGSSYSKWIGKQGSDSYTNSKIGDKLECYTSKREANRSFVLEGTKVEAWHCYTKSKFVTANLICANKDEYTKLKNKLVEKYKEIEKKDSNIETLTIKNSNNENAQLIVFVNDKNLLSLTDIATYKFINSK